MRRRKMVMLRRRRGQLWWNDILCGANHRNAWSEEMQSRHERRCSRRRRDRVVVGGAILHRLC